VMDCHGFFFMVAYFSLMEICSYEFMLSLDVLMDSCEMIFGAMVDDSCLCYSS
jgi:hypothetical protein